MNQYHVRRNASVDKVMNWVLFLGGIVWFVGWSLAGWRARAAGQDATQYFFWGYILLGMGTPLPARYWRYIAAIPRTIEHWLVWAYLAQSAAVIITLVMRLLGAREQAETALLLLAPACLLIHIALFWQDRASAVRVD